MDFEGDDNEDIHQFELQYLTPMEEKAKKAPESTYLDRDHCTLNIVGAGYKGGQPKTGVELAPSYFRSRSIVNEIANLGWKVKDLGDVIDKDEDWIDNDPQTESGVKNPRRVGNACKQLHDFIVQNNKNNFTLTLGGDHSFAMGSISALLEIWKDLSIIWVDAHGDINTPSTSPSGNLHGMPIAFLLGMVSEKIPGFEWLTTGKLDPSRIVYVGLRHIDFDERENIRNKGIKAFSLHEIDKFGIGAVMDMAFKHLGDRPVHLSFDIDAIDPFVCPSTGTRVAGGLSFREACYVCEAVSATSRLVSMDITEFNPKIGHTSQVSQTCDVSLSLLRCALGHTIL